MSGERVKLLKIRRPDGELAKGTVTGPLFPYGPSDVLVDGTTPSRPVEAGDWELLPPSEQDGGVDRV